MMDTFQITKKDEQIIISNNITDEKLVMVYPYDNDLYWILIGNQNNGNGKFIIPNTDTLLFPKINQLFKYVFEEENFKFSKDNKQFNDGANFIMRRELFDNNKIKFNSDELDDSSITIYKEKDNYILSFNSLNNSYLKSIRFSTGENSQYRSAVYPFINIYKQLNNELTYEKEESKAI